jgi:hypothetical protein
VVIGLPLRGGGRSGWTIPRPFGSYLALACIESRQPVHCGSCGVFCKPSKCRRHCGISRIRGNWRRFEPTVPEGKRSRLSSCDAFPFYNRSYTGHDQPSPRGVSLAGFGGNCRVAARLRLSSVSQSHCDMGRSSPRCRSSGKIEVRQASPHVTEDSSTSDRPWHGPAPSEAPKHLRPGGEIGPDHPLPKDHGRPRDHPTPRTDRSSRPRSLCGEEESVAQAAGAGISGISSQLQRAETLGADMR